MRRKEFELLQESYEETKVKNYIDRLYSEGYSQEQIEEILSEAGMLSRGLAHVKGLFNKDSLKNAGNYLKGKLASSPIGQKTAEYAEKGSELLQKGMKKGLQSIGLDKKAIEKSSAYKGLGGLGKKVKDKIEGAVQKGYEAESSVRAKKLESLLDIHQKDLEEVHSAISNFTQDFREKLSVFLESIIEDYEKIGGLSKTRVGSTLKPLLIQKLSEVYLEKPLKDMMNYEDFSQIFRKEIVDYINKEKASGAQGLGLRTAHKLKA